MNGLSEYQGPALLAYNDALFGQSDFDSLTSLGDSKKLQDKAATGKFGLGFSSVCIYFEYLLICQFSRSLLISYRSSTGLIVLRFYLEKPCFSLTHTFPGHRTFPLLVDRFMNSLLMLKISP